VKVATKKKESKEVVPQSFAEVVAASVEKLEQVLKNVPQDKLAQAKKEVDRLLEGDLSWADLAQYTPEKIFKIAEMGYHQFQIGKYDSAERLFKGLTVIDPDNYYYHQMLGATFQRKEKYPEAVVEYSVAVDKNSKDVVSLTNRGEVYFKLGIYELANADFDKAIGLDAKGDNAWANRAKMLREQIRLLKRGK